MARKHHHPKVHYGRGYRGSLCGLLAPGVHHRLAERRDKVTCQACLAILEATSAPERPDPHAARQFRLALREYRLAVGTGDVRPPRRLGDPQGGPALSLRLP